MQTTNNAELLQTLGIDAQDIIKKNFLLKVGLYTKNKNLTKIWKFQAAPDSKLNRKKRFKLLKYIPADLEADDHIQGSEVHPEPEFEALNFSEVEFIFEGDDVVVLPPILSADKPSTIHNITESELASSNISTMAAIAMDITTVTSPMSFPPHLATPTTTTASVIGASVSDINVSNTNLISVVSPITTPLSLVTSVTTNDQVNNNIENNKSINKVDVGLDKNNCEEIDTSQILCVYCQKILNPNNVANHMQRVHNKTVKNTEKIVNSKLKLKQTLFRCDFCNYTTTKEN